jgi:hypothetical protein
MFGLTDRLSRSQSGDESASTQFNTDLPIEPFDLDTIALALTE